VDDARARGMQPYDCLRVNRRTLSHALAPLARLGSQLGSQAFSESVEEVEVDDAGARGEVVRP